VSRTEPERFPSTEGGQAGDRSPARPVRRPDGEPSRASTLRRGLGLEWLTVGWNVVEGLIAVAAAAAAGSVALLGFGVDSFIESLSGGILIWRLTAERRAAHTADVEALDRRAHKLVAGSLVALAVYVAADAARTLWVRDRPAPSYVGIALTTVSLGVMVWLARAKRRVARRLGSRALEADAFQTTACWWLSLTTLVGIGLNAALGWWWADPLAALGITVFLAREAREAWQGEDCCEGEPGHRG
jgi:divalent metal cation (Fe/Co/Zn/Cd) transporter